MVSRISALRIRHRSTRGRGVGESPGGGEKGKGWVGSGWVVQGIEGGGGGGGGEWVTLKSLFSLFFSMVGRV